MKSRKGVLGLTLFLLIWMVPVSADDSADEIVAMMSWWEEYGRDWNDMGVDSSLTTTDEDAAFAWLDGWFSNPWDKGEERSAQ